MSVWYLIPMWFVLALVIPTGWSVGRAYRRSRGSRTVICPETGQPAGIELDARDAVAMHVIGNPVRKIQSCSRWPERQDCTQDCVAQVARAV
jgi:hypothetical protein